MSHEAPLPPHSTHIGTGAQITGYGGGGCRDSVCVSRLNTHNEREEGHVSIWTVLRHDAQRKCKRLSKVRHY